MGYQCANYKLQHIALFCAGINFLDRVIFINGPASHLKAPLSIFFPSAEISLKQG